MDIIERFAQIVADADGPLTILELGSHNGYHTQLLASTLHNSGKAYRCFAFEPDQRQHKPLIEATTSLNVQIIPAAIGAADEDSVDFHLSDGIQQRGGDGHGQHFDGSSSIRQPTHQNAVAYP